MNGAARENKEERPRGASYCCRKTDQWGRRGRSTLLDLALYSAILTRGKVGGNERYGLLHDARQRHSIDVG